MIVHFIASIANIDESIEDFQNIVTILRDNGHVLAKDWIKPAHQRAIKAINPDEAGWQEIAKENLEAIAKADVVIAEITQNSLVLGYQIATAVQQKKPVLLIQKKGAASSHFLWNMPEEWLSREEYNEGTLKDKIEKFLDENDIKSKDMRFNFFIDRKIYNYLRWASFKTGKTKAEILRDLVEKEITRKEDI